VTVMVPMSVSVTAACCLPCLYVPPLRVELALPREIGDVAVAALADPDGPVGDRPAEPNVETTYCAPSTPPLGARKNLNRHPRHILKHALKDVVPRSTVKHSGPENAAYKSSKKSGRIFSLPSPAVCENASACRRNPKRHIGRGRDRDGRRDRHHNPKPDGRARRLGRRRGLRRQRTTTPRVAGPPPDSPGAHGRILRGHA
jgi:hypothetical protein